MLPLAFSTLLETNGRERMAINGGGDRARARTREKVSKWTCPRLRGRPLAGIKCTWTLQGQEMDKALPSHAAHAKAGAGARARQGRKMTRGGGDPTWQRPRTAQAGTERKRPSRTHLMSTLRSASDGPAALIRLKTAARRGTRYAASNLDPTADNR